MNDGIHKGIFYILLFHQSVVCMHIDIEPENNSFFYHDPSIISYDHKESFYLEAQWVCRFSFLNKKELPQIAVCLGRLKPQLIHIASQEYILPEITVGLTPSNTLVTLCNPQFEECLEIRYGKSIKKNIGFVTSSVTQLRYVPNDHINCLLLWRDNDDKEIIDLPLDNGLILEQLFCCIIDQKMSLVHRLKDHEESLVVSFVDPNKPEQIGSLFTQENTRPLHYHPLALNEFGSPLPSSETTISSDDSSSQSE